MSIGFKEWALVCEALGNGTQSIILRKGGIAEGRDGFRFKHDEFLLFPTLYHEQLAKTKLPQDAPIIVKDLAARMDLRPFLLIHNLMELNIFATMNSIIEPETAAKLCEKHGFIYAKDSGIVHKQGIVRIQYTARVEWTELVTDPAIVASLSPFHIWKDSEIEQRFRYDDVQGVNLAFIRIYRLEPPFTFPDEPKYGGCRSWVTFPDLPPGTEQIPVLDDATHTSREAAVRTILKKTV
jgi:hypothetical protein